MNNRLLELDGASNFRDLGGYEATDGMRLKKGLVYRSDSLSYLTQNDIKFKKLVLKRFVIFEVIMR
jgi:protein-tyrosine phosphatase